MILKDVLKTNRNGTVTVASTDNDGQSFVISQIVLGTCYFVYLSRADLEQILENVDDAGNNLFLKNEEVK